MRREWDICAAMLWMGVLTVMLCCGISFLNPSYAFAAKKYCKGGYAYGGRYGCFKEDSSSEDK